MTKPFLRLAGALLILGLAACSQTAKPTLPPGQAPVLDKMTDPGTGEPVIAGPVLKGTAPRTPGKSSSVSSIGESAGQPAEALNTASRAERAQAAAPVVATSAHGSKRLGSTIASLGDPSLPGFWIKTPLVGSESAGRIVNPATGKSANVRLIPLGGPASGGSQVSLPALQMLGVSLTDLPSIEVYGS